MYKAMKDDKIRAISATNSEFPCMVKDSVVEDTEHTVEDYSQLITGEWVLKSDFPAPTQEEQRQKRQQAYIKEADPLRYDYEEDVARYGTDSEQAQTDKELWLNKKDEIRERYPYPEGE